MKCVSCGKELNPGAAFCTSCGTNQPPMQQSQYVAQPQPATPVSPVPIYNNQAPVPPPAKKSGGIGFLLIGIACGVAVMFLLTFFGIIPIGNAGKTDEEPVNETTGESTEVNTEAAHVIEGTGYGTPEEAATAYLEAFRGLDVDKMISAFAVESYIENSDFKAQLERVDAWMFTNNPRIPVDNPLALDISIHRRQGEIASSIEMQYMTLFMRDSGVTEGTPIPFGGDQAALDSFISALSDPEYLQELKALQIVEFVDPSSLSEQYQEPANVSYLETLSKIYGADKIQSIAAQVEINGQDYLFCFDAIRYGDKWYLSSFTGNIGNILGVPVFSQGVILMSELGF